MEQELIREVIQPETADRGRSANLGTRRMPKLPPPRFPDATVAIQDMAAPRSTEAVDVLLANPPSPDGAIWIRSQHRAGRRARENMIWPQVSLAQMAALLHPKYKVAVIDAIAERMGWNEFEEKLRRLQPRYYLTQVTAPTLTNDMVGCLLARSIGAKTMAIGTHVTPMARQTLEPYPALDFVLRGEPELTLVELIDTLEGKPTEGNNLRMLRDADILWEAIGVDRPVHEKLARIKGLVWRRGQECVTNADRPFIKNLDDLPIPLHRLLPLPAYRMPMLKGPYTFIVTGRGCTAGCQYCIKHVSYQNSYRIRSPEKIMEELWTLHQLGIHNIHMVADLFTLNRDQVVGLCKLIIKQGLKIKWTCNSRVDYVDPEELQLMAKAGCRWISWGIESGNEMILKRAHKGYRIEQAHQALAWAKNAGINNWGHFMIGLPGETVQTIRDTINLSKKLPVNLALFHIAAPYPGTPFFFEVLENGWFRRGTRWEEVDLDRSTVLEYGNLTPEDLEYWQRRAFREWAMRPGPIMTFLKMFNYRSVFQSALEIGPLHMAWARGGE